MVGRETVQETGGSGDVVISQLAVLPALVSQDVLHSARERSPPSWSRSGRGGRGGSCSLSFALF